jgi:prepilin-type processing-associated H-X9-DG protein
MFTEKYANPSANNSWNLNWGGNIWWEWAPKFAADVTGPKSKFLVQPTQAWCDEPVNYIVPEALGGSAQNACQYFAVTPHSGAINVGLGDGSVRNVSSGVSGITWWAAVTPAGGEVLGSDW